MAKYALDASLLPLKEASFFSLIQLWDKGTKSLYWNTVVFYFSKYYEFLKAQLTLI